MTDHDHRPRPPVQQILQLRQRVHIQIVSRLIQQQHVRLPRPAPASIWTRRRSPPRQLPGRRELRVPQQTQLLQQEPHRPRTTHSLPNSPGRTRRLPAPTSTDRARRRPAPGTRAAPSSPARPPAQDLPQPSPGTRHRGGRGVTRARRLARVRVTRRRPSAQPKSPASNRSKVVFPLPLGPTTPIRSPGPSCQVTSVEQHPPRARTDTSSASITVFPSRAVASRTSSTPSRAGGSSAISAFAASIRNRGLLVRAGGPRRSQASSLRSRLRRRRWAASAIRARSARAST